MGVSGGVAVHLARAGSAALFERAGALLQDAGSPPSGLRQVPRTSQQLLVRAGRVRNLPASARLWLLRRDLQARHVHVGRLGRSAGRRLVHHDERCAGGGAAHHRVELAQGLRRNRHLRRYVHGSVRSGHLAPHEGPPLLLRRLQRTSRVLLVLQPLEPLERLQVPRQLCAVPDRLSDL